MPREVTKNAIRSGGEVRTRRAAMPSASSQEIRWKPGSPRRRSIGYGSPPRGRRIFDDMERRAITSSTTRMSRRPTDSPQATTAYLTFPRLFKEGEHLVSVHTALILAGGESRRFGGPKALVESAGRQLIAHVADVMSSLADETIVSVEGPEGEASIRSILPGVGFVSDEVHGRGPIEGFRVRC